jgi:hypothetical protein
VGNDAWAPTPPPPEGDSAAESALSLITDLLFQLWQVDAALAELGAASAEIPPDLRPVVEGLLRSRPETARYRIALMRGYHALPGVGGDQGAASQR